MPSALLSALLLIACQDEAPDQSPPPTPAEPTVVEPEPAAPPPAAVPDEAALRTFLHDVPGAYGWETSTDPLSYDFFPDGRLHIQGPDGEATMWQGTWTLSGDQLTLVNSDEGTQRTVKAEMDGESLRLDGVSYKRYTLSQ